jgi:two-component system response regulator FixJ
MHNDSMQCQQAAAPSTSRTEAVDSADTDDRGRPPSRSIESEPMETEAPASGTTCVAPERRLSSAAAVAGNPDVDRVGSEPRGRTHMIATVDAGVAGPTPVEPVAPVARGPFLPPDGVAVLETREATGGGHAAPDAPVAEEHETSDVEGTESVPSASRDALAKEIEPTVFFVQPDESACELADTLQRETGFTVERFDTVDAFLTAYNGGRPGCLLVRDQPPATRSIQLLTRLAERKANIPTLVLADGTGTRNAIDVIKAGAHDLIGGPYDASRVACLVRAAIRHDVEQRRQQAGKVAVLDRWQSLSDRERLTATRIVMGVSTRDVAKELGLSDRTVEVYRARIRQKMQAACFADLVRQVVAAQLV